MIEGSIRNVETGIKIANETAEALKKIVSGVSDATELVSSIAIASKEQAMGIEQLNQGILQVSQVVQSNAATPSEERAPPPARSWPSRPRGSRILSALSRSKTSGRPARRRRPHGPRRRRCRARPGGRFCWRETWANTEHSHDCAGDGLPEGSPSLSCPAITPQFQNHPFLRSAFVL